MGEEEVAEALMISPKRHSGWSLLTLGVSFAGDVLNIAADYASTLTVIVAQHTKQLEWDREFKSITED